MPALTIDQVSKVFGATVAVDNVTLSIEAGTVHSLVGENGAGKSTLLGMLAGRLAPSSGSLSAFGTQLDGASPRSARHAGVVAIYQELTVIPTMSAMSNVFLSDPRRRLSVLDKRRMRERFKILAGRVGANMSPDSMAGSLSVAEQQLLEVMRALDADARIIVFDEPTASLPLAARDRLLRLMDQLRGEGVTVVFVSHNLEEVLRISDHITVFRDGQIVASEERAAWSRERLITAMLGTAAAERLRHQMGLVRTPVRSTTPAVVVSGVQVPGALYDITFSLQQGEILGIAGLVGSGRSTLMRAIAGLEPAATGTLSIAGRSGPLPRSVRKALRRGVALLPEDRKTLGLIGGMSSADNIVISRIDLASRWGWLGRSSSQRAALEISQKFGIKREYLPRLARQLSGGNQQKLLLARWALRRPIVLLADEPTRGIDIGAKQQIRDTLRDMADQGMSVIVVSSEHEELLEVADRLVVLSQGRITAEFDNRNRDVDERDVLNAAFIRELSHVS